MNRAACIGAVIGAWERGRRAALEFRPLVLSDMQGCTRTHGQWVRAGYRHTQDSMRQLTLFRTRARRVHAER